MPAPLAPLAVSTNSIRGELSGTLSALAAVAAAAYPNETQEDAEEKVLAAAIRAAMSKLESKSKIPFFVTRYTTKELATQEGWVQATDFHKFIQPCDWRRDTWWRQGARFHLPWSYVGSVTELRLTLSNDSQVFDVDVTWLQVDQEHAACYVLPSGLATAGLGYQNLLSYGVWVRGAATGIVPLLIHSRFTAGLVERTGTYADPDDEAEAYDPDAESFNTTWDQELVQLYRDNLKLLATAYMLKPIGAYLERGGIQISMDGLSETINSQVLQQRTETYEKAATDWAEGFKQETQGMTLVMM